MMWSRSRQRRRRRPVRLPLFAKRYRPFLERLETRLAPSVSVLTYHNDNSSTGSNLAETSLTPANVNSTSFGKLLTIPVDGQVYAQPLYDPGVSLIAPGRGPGKYNVVYVATEHDSLYALDANSGEVFWKDSFINPSANVTTVPNGDVNSSDLMPEIGITSTPVIDSAAKTLYVEVKTKEVHGGNHHYVHRLHAIDITTGAEKLGGPTTIADTIWDGGASYFYVSGPYLFGSGDGSVNGKITFNALRQMVRPALTLADGNIYIASASHGDNGPYHGWVLSYNAQTLQLDGVFNSTPNGGLGGIWQGGGRVAVDDQGFLYFMTGNGTFDTGLNSSGLPGAGDYGDSFVKLAVDPTTSAGNQSQNGWGLKVVDYFTPFDQAVLSVGDVDLASGGILLLPDSAGSAAHPHLMIGSGKAGRVYLIDRDNMGHFSGTTDRVVQHNTVISGSYDTPAFFNSAFYYAGGNTDNAKAFSVGNGAFVSAAVSQSSDTFGSQGATPSISADGTLNGIAWLMDRATSQLRAYDAKNLGNKIYTSAQAANGRDQVGSVVKFSVPTVADGQVYIGTSNSLVVYGLLQATTLPPSAPTGLAAKAVSANQINLTWTNSAANAVSVGVESSTDGMHFTQIGAVSANVTSYVAVGLQATTAYSFRVRAVNSVGPSDYSNIAGDTTAGSAGSGLDLSVGFAGAAGILGLNGSTKIAGSMLQLTNGQLSEAGSVFSVSRLSATSFNTQFSFRLVNPAADGFTFTIQGAGQNALGASGGALGYGAAPNGMVSGIPTSVAVKFDLFSDAGEGSDSTGLYLNGATPTKAGSIDLSQTGINLHSGHVFIAALSYDGATLKVTILDTSTGASASQSYAVNIPAVVGGNTAYFGFTGATGTAGATQNILSWAYSAAAATVPPAPAGLSVTPVSATEAALSWATSGTGVGSFLIERKAAGGVFSQITAVLGATSFLDTGLNAGGQYTYRVRAFNALGTSAYSTQVPVTLLTLPLRPTGLKATHITSAEVDLAWQDHATNEDGYRVFRQINASSMFFLIASLPAGANTYPDISVSGGTTYEYHVEAFNAAGYSGDNALLVTTLPGGPPPAAPTGVTATPGPGQVALNWSGSTGANNYNIYRSTTKSGEGNTPYLSGVPATFFTDVGLPGGDIFYYEVSAVGFGGEGARSAEVSATTRKLNMDFAGGFAGAGAILRLNGSATINGSALRLTDGKAHEAGSAFSQNPVGVNGFTAQFNFQLTSATADGFTFTFEGVNPSQVGLGGGGLGYATIAKSVAVKFDLFNNFGEGNSSTGLYVNGALPTNAGSIDLASAGIDLHSGHTFNVAMSYGGTTLRVTITDIWTRAKATQAYLVDIPGLVGGSTAFIGFTAATGGGTAIQDILSWAYVPAGAVPTVPTNLIATAGFGEVSLNWTAAQGAISYNVYRSTSPGAEGDTPVSTGLTLPSLVDNGLTNGVTYYYVVTAVNANGETSQSGESSATPHAFTAHVNFSNNTSQVPAGYVNDIGQVYGDRGNGLTFGWNIDNTANARARDAANAPDERYASFMHMQRPSNPDAFWEIAVRDGNYFVHLASGDPSAIDSVFAIDAEGVPALNGTSAAASHLLENAVTVAVTDGRLTIRTAPGASNNKIDYIDITQTG